MCLRKGKHMHWCRSKKVKLFPQKNLFSSNKGGLGVVSMKGSFNACFIIQIIKLLVLCHTFNLCMHIYVCFALHLPVSESVNDPTHKTAAVVFLHNNNISSLRALFRSLVIKIPNDKKQRPL